MRHCPVNESTSEHKIFAGAIRPAVFFLTSFSKKAVVTFIYTFRGTRHAARYRSSASFLPYGAMMNQNVICPDL